MTLAKIDKLNDICKQNARILYKIRASCQNQWDFYFFVVAASIASSSTVKISVE